MSKKCAAVIADIVAIVSLTACGSGPTTKASTETVPEDTGDTSETTTTAQPLASGLSGTCTGDNENLQSVALKTSGQYLSVEIPNPLTAANESVMYSIMFTDPETGYMTQAGFKNVFSTGEYSRFVFDVNTSQQKSYIGTFDADFATEKFSANLPDPAIKGGQGTQWVATLSVDGQDIATCPSDGSSATLE